MRVVVGLGNPGPEYAASRHNAGFMVVQAIAKRWGVALCPSGWVVDGRCEFLGENVRLLLPQTFMNRSGTVLAGMFAEAAGENLVVAYDDVDLPIGSVRIRQRGGSGGHRGVASVIEACGVEFARVRVGVGRPPEGIETSVYVLSRMEQEDREALAVGVVRGVDAVECILKDGVAAAMNRFNGSPSALPS